jgi:LysM repeat protein
MEQNPSQPTPEKQPATPQEKPQTGKTYVVKKGDTAFSIAKKNNISVAQLIQWNHMESGNVKVGEKLQVSE